VTSITGSASHVSDGTTAQSQIDIAWNFTYNGTINLATASLTVKNLLTEVGGAGELVNGVPLTLVAGGQGTPDEGFYFTSPAGAKPAYRFTVKNQDPQQGTWTAHLKVDFGTMGKNPQLCAGNGNTFTTSMFTSFWITPSGGGSPITVSTTQPWRCLDLENGNPADPDTLRTP
jgi:hypothetical protein